MFKKVTLFAFIVSLHVTISAQSNYRQLIGVHMGGNYATIRGTATAPILVNAWKISYSAGISYQLFFSDMFGFDMNLNFQDDDCGYRDQKNDGINDNQTGKANIESRLKYVNLPVSCCISPLTNKMIVFKSGLYVSKLISAYLKGDPHWQFIYNSPIDKNISDQIAPMDWGLVLGMESNIPLRKNILFCADLNYNHGLQNIRKNSAGSSYNSFLILNVGLKIGLNQK